MLSKDETQKINRAESVRRIILIPDSFKGTFSSQKICEIMATEIKKHAPQTLISMIPVADGGEGSVDAFVTAVGGERLETLIQGPYGEEIPGFYGILNDGTAVVEMAAAAGLTLVGPNRNPGKTTTFGVGQLMRKAIAHNPKRLIVGLGGSATNDGGCGAAAACGVRFFERDGKPFVPVGETLIEIARIDKNGLDSAFENVEIVTMCDIDNPLTGPEGAAAIFSPQKGADSKMVEALDHGLKHLAEIVQKDFGLDIDKIPGSGAAGGMGGGMVAFFGARMEMGIEVVLDTVAFNQLVQSADLIFTGEGKIDRQSLRGKVVIGVARRAKSLGIPVFAFVGDIGDDIEDVYAQDVSGIFSINRVAVPFAEAKERAESDLALTVDNVLRVLKQFHLI